MKDLSVKRATVKQLFFTAVEMDGSVWAVYDSKWWYSNAVGYRTSPMTDRGNFRLAWERLAPRLQLLTWHNTLSGGNSISLRRRSCFTGILSPAETVPWKAIFEWKYTAIIVTYCWTLLLEGPLQIQLTEMCWVLKTSLKCVPRTTEMYQQKELQQHSVKWA